MPKRRWIDNGRAEAPIDSIVIDIGPIGVSVQKNENLITIENDGHCSRRPLSLMMLEHRMRRIWAHIGQNA